MQCLRKTSRHTHPKRASLLLAAALGSVALFGGCASQTSTRQTIAPSPQVSLEIEAEQAIVDGVAAVRRGDLATALSKATIANEYAQTQRQQRLAKSLLLLIEGAQAILDGQVDQAGIAWSQIPDPTLRSEVMQRADRLGVHVPIASTTSTTRQENY